MAFMLAAMLSPAPLAETPHAFVERLYAGYCDPDYDPLAKPGRIFAPALVAAIREDLRFSRDDVGYMDADPICQCQDAAGLRHSIEEIGQPGAKRATARLRLDFGGSEQREVELKLVRTKKGWRIADIATAVDASLLESLRRFNRRRSSQKG